MTAKALALEVFEKIVWIEFRIIDEECGEYFMNGETWDGSLLISPLSLFTVQRRPSVKIPFYLGFNQFKNYQSYDLVKKSMKRSSQKKLISVANFLFKFMYCNKKKKKYKKKAGILARN